MIKWIKSLFARKTVAQLTPMQRILWLSINSDASTRGDGQ